MYLLYFYKNLLEDYNEKEEIKLIKEEDYDDEKDKKEFEKK